jgi:ribosomal protein L21E
MFLENNEEIAEIIAKMEKEAEAVVVEEVEVPVEENIKIEVPVEEIIEDDVLVEDRPPVEVRTYEIGDAVVIAKNAVNVAGNDLPDRYKGVKVYIRTIKNGCYGFSINKTGRTSGFLVKPEYLTPYVENAVIKEEFHSYLMLVKVDELDIKSRPDETSKTLKTIHRDGLFTVVDEHNGWGHLKIGGWIPLDKVKRITP